MDVPFPCIHCGKCCTMLEKKTWTGISLFPWERYLFPEQDIRPSLGIGENPEDPGFKVILYTYARPGCLYYEETECTIYDQRPLVCKSYPFRVTKQGSKTIFVVAPECTIIQEWPEETTTHQRYLEMYAAELIGDHLSRFYKAPEPRWRYKPRRGWTRIGTNKTSD